LPNGPASPHRCTLEFAASVGSRAASISFEQSDQEQDNHRPDDGVDDLGDDTPDEDKPDQGQEPTGMIDVAEKRALSTAVCVR
jgi:hypothetical protein